MSTLAALESRHRLQIPYKSLVLWMASRETSRSCGFLVDGFWTKKGGPRGPLSRRNLRASQLTFRVKSSTTKEVWSETSSVPTRKICTVCPLKDVTLKLFCE